MTADISKEQNPPPEKGDQPNQAASNVTVIGTAIASAKATDNKAAAIPNLDEMLRDAKELLDYASRAGIALPPAIVDRIVSSGTARELSTDDKVKTIAAVTELTARLKPVTAETLKFSNKDARPTLRRYEMIVFILGPILLVASIWSFIAAGLSGLLAADITQANQFALTLNSENVKQISETSDMTISDAKTLATMQQFAATIREVRALSRNLGWLVVTPDFPENMRDDKQFELNPPVNFGQIVTKTAQFQTVRAFAKEMQDREGLASGAITNCILPILYAVLGACAYLLKTFSEQVKMRAFLPSDMDWARLTIAAIGGGVLGLFSNFNLSQGTSLSLLALAFLIGYATDVFFSFLDSLQQVFTKSKSNQPAQNQQGSNTP